MKHPKVKILIGPPASGKSTWSENFIRNNHGWVRVSRDSFRYMLRNEGFCKPNIEQLITKLMDDAIIQCLVSNQSVIVDNTHCKLRYINQVRDLVKYYADVEYKIFEISKETLLERDSQREKSVGSDVIEKMYSDFKDLLLTFDYQNDKRKLHRPMVSQPSDGNNEAVIFDLDGTLAHAHNRGYFDGSKVIDDKLNTRIYEQILFQKKQGREIILLTGREGTEETIMGTKMWLEFHNVPYDKLFFRKEHDMRKDSVIKKELFENEIKPYYDVMCVYDDRHQVLDMWYKLGIFTFNVNQGNFKF